MYNTFIKTIKGKKMSKLNLTALLLGAALFTGLGAVSLSASDSKCGAGKCGKSSKVATKKCGGESKPMKCGAGKCGKSPKAATKKCGGESKPMKCGAGKCGSK